MLHLQHMLLLKHLVLFLALMQAPSFEVASVKPSTSRVRSSIRGGPGTEDAEQVTFTNVTLVAVLMRAYDVKTTR